MKKLISIILILILCAPAQAVDYAKRFPTDTALAVVTPGALPGLETDPISLHIDQTTPQTITGGAPIFNAGATVNGTLDLTGLTADVQLFLDESIGGGIDGHALSIYRHSGVVSPSLSLYVDSTGISFIKPVLGAAAGNGPSLNLVGGDGVFAATNPNGGDVNIHGGAKLGAGVNGSVVMTGLVNFTGITGNIDFGSNNLLTSGTLGAGATTVTSLTDSGLTISRVPYASTNGLLIDSVSMTFNVTNGLILAAGSASAMNLSDTGGTTVGGILLGTDTNLYRSAANTLTTDDNFVMGDSTAAGLFKILGAAGQNRQLSIYSGANVAANLRWAWLVNSTAESGSNAGSNFGIQSSTDAGGALATNLLITRSSGAWTIGLPTTTDAALSPVSMTAKQVITATAAKNFIGFTSTLQYQIAGGFSNTGSSDGYFFQNLRGLVGSGNDTGTLTNQFGFNGNVGHNNTDKYINPLTTTSAGLAVAMNYNRGTITNSYTLLGSANVTISAPATWAANTVYTVASIVKPTVANGYYYACSTAGTSDPTTEPVWPATSVAGQTPATIADGTAVWTEIIVPSITNERGVYITSATAHNYLGGTLGIGTASSLGTQLRIANSHSAIAWGAAGSALNISAMTTTDTTSSGTVAIAASAGIALQTIAASSATTFTDAATLYIANAPATGTNVTITKAWGLWLDAGDARFDGNMTIGATSLATPNGNLDVFSITGGVLTLGRNDTSVTANDVIGQMDFYAKDTSTTTTTIGARIQVIGTNTIATDINPMAMIFSTTPTGVGAALTEALRIDNAQTLLLAKTISNYNSIATVSNGVPSELATVDLTAQGAAITATTLYAVPASGAGLYRVSWVATVTQAATTSCVLGGAAGFTLKYTDGDDSVVKTENPTTATVSAINATGTSISGTELAYCKASTNLQYLFGYTSAGVTPMQFNLHIKVEKM